MEKVEMSRRRKKIQTARRQTPAYASKKIIPVLGGIGFAVLVTICLSIWMLKADQTRESESKQQAANTQIPEIPKSVSTAKPEFEKLKGIWQRPDGGYVLEIKQVSSEGKIDAAYYNPNPINVFQARAWLESGKLNAYVELRDRLYPGNYYTLKYDASNDHLAGVYHHLGIGQQFEIVFMRIK
jgi:hypothetical protein